MSKLSFDEKRQNMQDRRKNMRLEEERKLIAELEAAEIMKQMKFRAADEEKGDSSSDVESEEFAQIATSSLGADEKEIIAGAGSVLHDDGPTDDQLMKSIVPKINKQKKKQDKQKIAAQEQLQRESIKKSAAVANQIPTAAASAEEGKQNIASAKPLNPTMQKEKKAEKSDSALESEAEEISDYGTRVPSSASKRAQTSNHACSECGNNTEIGCLRGTAYCGNCCFKFEKRYNIIKVDKSSGEVTIRRSDKKCKFHQTSAVHAHTSSSSSSTSSSSTNASSSSTSSSTLSISSSILSISSSSGTKNAEEK